MTSSADRISDLPEFILHQILSYLPLKDSVRTSVVSKRWNSTRKSFSVLDFSQKHYMKHIEYYSPSEYEQRLREFLSFIDTSLRTFSQSGIRIQTLLLNLYHIPGDSIPLIDSWLPLALRSGVSELSFKVRRLNSFDYYRLPEKVFSVASDDSFSRYFKLRKLSIYNDIMSDKMIRDITRNCPNITDITLSIIGNVKTLEISELHKLENFKIIGFPGEKIFVNAPSLKSFTYWGNHTRKPCEIDLLACRALKYLDLRASSISDDMLHLHISRFRVLETLTLFLCYKLQRVMISLPRLKILKINGCHAIESIHIDAPTLSEFEFSVFDDFPLPSLNFPVHCNVHLTMYVLCGTVFDSSWFIELRRFLNNFTQPRCTHLNLSFFANYKVSFDQNMVEEADSRTVEVDHLELTSPRESDIKVLMEGLLWSFHPKAISLSNGSLSKALCEKLIRSKDWSCCKRTHFKCWRHSLKVAKINFIGNFSPKEKNGGIEWNQFRFALDQSSDFWTGKRAQFLLEWDYDTTLAHNEDKANDRK